MKILIIEDEIDLQQSIVSYLQKEANICEVASNFVEGSYKASLYDYNINLLDINLVNGSGIQILKHLKKEQKHAGVIIISANNSLDDKLSGLDLGADDYLTKPFHLAELNSRIKAVLRRNQFDGCETVTCNEIDINTSSRVVQVSDKEISLTRKEFVLLLFFLPRKNECFERKSLHSNFGVTTAI